MKRCIIYGVGSFERRRWIEHFLDENKFEIIGYSDGIFQNDPYSQGVFYKLEEIPTVEYDFIIVNACLSKNEIIENLKQNGVSSEKLVVPILYQENVLMNGYINYDIAEDMRCVEACANGKTLVFGMSEAAECIDQLQMKVAYMFAGTARDIYYNFEHYKYALSKGYFAYAKEALFIIPYWAFSYDMSVDVNQYRRHTMLSHGYLSGDYHRGTDLHNSEITNAINNYDMFGRKLFEYYRWVRIKPIVDTILPQIETTNVQMDARWNRRKGLEEDNIKFFCEHIELLTRNEVNKIKIIVPPNYSKVVLNSNPESNLSKINRAKKGFYECIENIRSNVGIELSVIDCFDLFEERIFFYDQFHLNTYGAEKFTEYIINKIEME